MIGNESGAHVLIEDVEGELPDAVRLAEVVCLAARIEPELLRSARIELLPGVDAGTEADLWFSPLVESRGRLAMTLRPDVEAELRRRLRRDQARLVRAWEVLADVHAYAPETIKLEEEVTRWALTDDQDALEKIETLLQQAVVTLVKQERRAIARWAVQALPRLPARAREAQAFWMLVFSAGARLGRQIIEADPPADALRTWLPAILPANLTTVVVGVRLIADGVELGAPTMDGAHEIELPETRPLLLDVSWQEQGRERSVLATIQRQQRVTITTGSGPITLRTAAGRRYVLRPQNVAIEDEVATRRPRVFLSFARPDAAFADRLRADLTGRGFNVWRDPPGLERPVQGLHAEVEAAIQRTDQLILIVGADRSDVESVRGEWELALSLCTPITLLLRADVELGPELALQRRVSFPPARPYGEALDELVRALQEPVGDPGPLWRVPQLPRPYMPRRDAFLWLVARLDGLPLITMIAGLGGSGKSVLAAAFARTCEVRRRFPDGVFWVRVGFDFRPLRAQSYLAGAAGAGPQAFTDISQGVKMLRAAFAQKACLLVLDGVWDDQQFEAFDVLGPRGCILLTTRNQSLRPRGASIDAHLLILSPLSEDEAEAWLATWAGPWEGTADSARARSVLRALLARLPLTAALLGGLAMEIGWAALWDWMQQSNTEQQGVDEDDQLGRIIDMAFNTLTDAERDAYQMLALAPDGTVIPEAALSVLWDAPADTARDIQRTLTTLETRRLIQRDVDGIDLHAILRDYIRTRIGDLAVAHNHVLAAYAKRSSAGWASGPNDGYFFQHLAFHLQAAGRSAELGRLLLDLDWLQARLDATDIADLLEDYPDASATPSDDTPASLFDIQTLRRALQLSAPILARDTTQLRGQLLWRLMNHPSERIQALLRQARRGGNARWLRPQMTSLASQAGAETTGPAGHVGPIIATAMTADGRLLVSAGDDRTVRLWNTVTGTLLRTFRAPAGVATITTTPDELRVIAALDDGAFAAWDLSLAK